MTNTHDFDTGALRLLDEVAMSGSFTAAAELLGYTQSAVSRRVAALERAAGGPLFERLARGVRLTPAGLALHRHAVAVLDRLDRAGEELAAIHRGSGGTLRVGAFATANVDLVPGALSRFAAARPEVELRLVEGLTGRLMERLGAGALDVAVISDYPAGLPAEAGHLVRLREDRLLVALPAAHRLAGEERVRLRDLAGETWIEAAPRGQPTLLAAACAAAGFTPRGGLRVAEWTGKFGFVAAGLGVTLVPELAARAVPAGVVLRPLHGTAPARTVYAALPQVRLPAALELVRLLGEWQTCTTVSPT
ncbi:LysR family transcriptional regulator [Nonomuraea muscovyensis]|jgi:DNA-binding transcriptional LysR family regulator|uniref:DNA-binding transcriptional LysR family regulator n=1 Tax=Nonomuraea muscovyensis TaxID=1124761 RepID=A0A7X0C526_9ACTN|nr:LysR family transcriptional regulator [Nonomuraea muscovyensis]MBB6348669.1 DNA-binding transcriptional LysR family regulator [Nonomuraea muscovyensis]MDF2705163.1 LysR family transcriptional regulator [Nonomuraea muscovyensis]